ncbi:hypothetical protein F4802DRAFT_611861 [Xylaria palmicola]|nr:hypothetical protein F4802DRAFT_611861 [Xylaria palmicola]
MPTTWSEFHVAVISNDSTLFPSFSSKQLSEGDADKITLAEIRKHAAASKKLKFTADGKTTLSDDTTLSYYMSLRGESTDDLKKQQSVARVTAAVKMADEGPKKPAIRTVEVELVLNKAGGIGGDGKTPNPSFDSTKAQDNIDKLIEKMNTGGKVDVGDLTKLSDSLGGLTTDKMDFAAQAGFVNYPEPLDLSEAQWDVVFKNTRALYGWVYKGDLLVKARKRAFQLRLLDTMKEDKPVPGVIPLPPIPPFYVWDDANVEVTEMTSALENTMATQGFSSTAVKAAASGGALGAQADASTAIETEHTAATKKIAAAKVNSVHVSYKFPRAAVEVDAYCLELTDECKRRALSCRNRADVDRWQREYGSVFATQFTLGGELISSRLFQSSDEAELSAFKDTVKTAAGMSLSTPSGSASASYASVDSKDKTEEHKSAQQSLRLAWQARGGNTLLCTNPPLWTSTVKDYRLWRIMDQEGMVKMIDLVKAVNMTAGDFLEHPETASKDPPGPEDVKRAWNLLSKALKDPEKYPVVDQVKQFYEGDKFSIEEFNASLAQDEKELALKERTSWPKLSLEQQVDIGVLAYKKRIITLS